MGIEPRKPSKHRSADAVRVCGRQHWGHRQREMVTGSARSETPGEHGNTSIGNWESPWLRSVEDGALAAPGSPRT